MQWYVVYQEYPDYVGNLFTRKNEMCNFGHFMYLTSTVFATLQKASNFKVGGSGNYREDSTLQM